jgi:glycosyltransferase involved in cell wall biosynthesis
MATGTNTDKEKRQPEISVIMSVRDGAQYLEEALDSLIAQTYNGWEAVLVDDGSSDETAKILEFYQRLDPRFITLTNPQSIGLAASLNRALEVASGTFIARMDADDICYAERLSTQRRWLINHPSHILLGSDVIRIDTQGNPIGRTYKPHTDRQIRIHMLFENPFIHPTTMWRRSALQNLVPAYNVSFDTSQDWDLWRRILPFGKVANLQTALLKQRFHKDSISATKRERQHRNSIRVQRDYFKEIFGHPPQDQQFFENINSVFMGDRANTPVGSYTRAQIAYRALQIILNIPSTQKSGHREIPDMLVDRAVRTGLYPPITKGWFSLFCLIMRYPLAVLKCFIISVRKRI